MISTKTINSRIQAFLLVLVMLMSCIPNACLQVIAESVVDNTNGFKLELHWSVDNVPRDNYVSEHSEDESYNVLMKVQYSNNEVSQGYEPGELTITVPGIKGAVRSGEYYKPSSIAADEEGAESKIYNWSYSYSEASDTFTFTNNKQIESKSVFEGSFEIMWTLPSRETIAEFEKTDMVAELFGDGFYTKSNAISYSQSRTKDEYSLTLEANPVFKDEMPSISGFPLKDEDGKEIEYVWVKYHVGGLLNYNSLGVKDSERFELYFAENAGVFTTVTTANGEKNLIELKNDRTLETPEKDGCQLFEGDTQKYNCYSIEQDINNETGTPYLKDIFVVYKKENYPNDAMIRAYARLYGTYNESETEELLAGARCEGAKSKYDYNDRPGDIYDVVKESYGIHNTVTETNGLEHGAVNSVNLTDGKGDYYSDLKLYLNFNPIIIDKDDIDGDGNITERIQRIDADYYDLEFIDDIMDISLKASEGSPSLRRLTDDEMHFTSVTIPPNTAIINSNGLPIQADTYGVEIYVRYAGESDGTFEKIDKGDIKISTTEKTVDFTELPKKVVGIKVIFRGIKESISTANFDKTVNDLTMVRCHYAFSIADEDIDEILTDGGSLINNMAFKLYRTLEKSGIKDEWFNPFEFDSGEDEYEGNEERYEFDKEIYGNNEHGVDREQYTLPILEIPNIFKMREATLREIKTKSDSSSVYFSGGMTSEFELGEGTEISNFSMFMAVPEGLKLEEIYKNPERLKNQLTFSTENNSYNSAYIANHTKITVYEKNGRQFLRFDFDFEDAPLIFKTLKVDGVPMYVNRRELNSGDNSYFMRTGMLVHQGGKWSSNNIDNLTVEENLWYDMDNDGNVKEPASFSTTAITYKYTEETELKLVKYVQTPLTNGRVNPNDKEASKYDDVAMPKTYIGGEYSYILEATVQTGSAKNIIFADAIESINDKSEWQGIFQSVDYSEILKVLENTDSGYSPKVYYSEKDLQDTFKDKDITSADLSSGDWKELTSSVDCEKVRTIAVDFGEAVAPEGSKLTLKINMKAPDDEAKAKKIARNSSHISYIKKNELTGEFNDNQHLDSNIVPVTYVPKGSITLTKIDGTTKQPITGAEFTLHKKNGSESETIGTYSVSENGKIFIDNLEYGTYYFEETTTPKGYVEGKNSDDIVIDSANESVTYTFENERKKGTFSIKKVSDRQSDVTLQGAEFSLYKSNGEFVSEKNTTGADGILTIENLDWGSYYLKETKAPDGYKISDEKIEFTINADNNAGKELGTVTVENEQIPAKVKLTKCELNMPYSEMPKSGNPVVNKTSPIKGAVYALYHEGDTPEEDKPITSRVTNDRGEIYVEDLTFGKYYFLEVSPAIGYKKYEEKISFEVTAKHTEKNVYCEITTADSRKTGDVYLLKKDNTAKGIVEANIVEGAIYRLYKFDSTKPDNFDEKKPLSVTPDSASGEGHYNYSTISGASTDMITCNEGFIEIHGLQWGDYILKEYKAPQGYELSDEKFEIHINKDNVSNQVILNDIDNQILGKVKLKKVSEKDKAPLPGAKFTLYRDDGSIYADDIETTGTDGTVEVENIPWGSYYFVEKEAPEGYGLNDKKFKFVVNYLTAGKTQEITVEDPEKNYQFTVTKKIKKSDIVFEHGNPTFIFEVKKTDGDNHVYRKTLSFSEDTTLTTGSDDYVTASVVFVVPMGTYEISEVSVSRYELEEITCLDGTATIESGKATFTVGESNQNFTFTFNNKKTDQSGTSDNSMITNTLNRSRAMIGIAAEYVGKDIVTEDVIPKEDVKVYALYDNGTKKLIPETDFTLSEVDITKPNSIQEIKVTYDKDGKNFEDKISVQIGNIVLFKYEKLTDYAAGYSGSIVITGYIGHSSVIDFPATLKVNEGGYEKTYKVLKIGNGATLTDKDNNSIFNKDIRTVTFAEGIVAIENNAFHPDNWDTANENYLQCELELPSTLETIGNNAFKCTQITKLTIKGNNLEQIGSSAFAGCANLTGDLIIPDSVTSIGDRAFASCTKFNGTLKLPNNPNFKNIYMNTFHGCKFTGKLEIPESVEKIGYGAFYAGEYSELVLHEGLKEISEPYSGDNWENCGSFADCSKLKVELQIPNTVTTIGRSAFQNSGFTSLKFESTSQLTEIKQEAFKDCTGFTGDLIIPDSVKTIGRDAFNACSKFNGKLKVSRNVETIDGYAFRNCIFDEIELASSKLKLLGDNAFWLGSSGPTKGNVIIPSNITGDDIGNNPFYNCSKISCIYYPKNLEDDSGAKFGIEGKVKFYTDYDNLRTQLGADLAKQLGVDTW